ncbi:MAG: hypothetical protein GXO75_13795 [Calditrichaeota bacterium]|nr:hypothetical protein [Calditrichota bacterium]
MAAPLLRGFGGRGAFDRPGDSYPMAQYKLGLLLSHTNKNVNNFEIGPDRQQFIFRPAQSSNGLTFFKKKKYFQILVNSLEHCVENKGLFLIGHVIMLNHLYCVTSNKENTNILRPGKEFPM